MVIGVVGVLEAVHRLNVDDFCRDPVLTIDHSVDKKYFLMSSRDLHFANAISFPRKS